MHDTAAPPSGAAISDLDIFTPENIKNPLGWHAELREPAPLVWFSKYDVWATGRFDEVHGILSDWKTFCSSAGVGLANFRHEKPWRPPSLLLEADPPEHTPRRTVAGRVMSHANLRKLREGFAREAAALTERLLEKGEIDGVADVAKPYILKVFPDAIGLAPEGREDLLLYGDMIFNAFGPLNDIFDRSMVEA
jgi:cytochrome P450